LYGKRALLDAMPPYQGGGEMIKEVTFEKTTYNDLPYKFEAGTPNIADVVAFRAAIDFVNETGKANIAAHEHELLKYFVQKLQSIDGAGRIKLIGTASEKVAVQSFIIDGVHHFDAGMMLDAKGIAVRTGHHCTQPLMKGFCIEGTVRASFSVYNTKEEVDVLVSAIERICKLR
jgi:cysteine desulfurase/selenocysteine lyase